MSTTAGGDGRAAGTARSPLPASDGDEDEAGTQARSRGQQVREAAHRYLEDGLLPVPAWAAQDGGCCCPRGAGCGRPGKHPRSVRSGPGPRDYSWKPLACRSHAEIDRRFADDGPYAAGNLMVAIPDGMMAIDVDDGGRAAAAGLAEVLGDLPPTLSHRTPHGEHLIYRTPPGWKGRAWVGKDPANPLPPGIDLRMPGQILMAAPSLVPGADRPARYGPLSGDHVAALPGSYVTAWTAPQPRPRPVGRRVPVPPDSAGRAARYVHEAMTRIAGDLASRQPGGRNAAAYAAGLKAGSLLGAARSTPGAEPAAWTDEQAEEALMDAAERNGYTGKDGPAEASRAIRSGLRNGLRSPRALPDFTTGPAPGQRQPSRRAAGRKAGRWQDMVPEDIRRQVEDADRAASDRRRAAITAHRRALEQHSQAATAATAAEVQQTRAAAGAAHEAYTRDGRHVTGRHDAAMLRWAAGIAAQRDQHAGQPAPAAEDTARVQANRAAVAANQAYKAGDLDRAGELTEQAAALDPSRAGMWQQHRNDITARRLITSARAAHAGGDRERAGQLLEDARQLDPRLRTLWDGSLPVQPATQPGRSGPGPGSTAPETDGTGGTGPAPPGERAPQGAWPSPPIHQVPDRAALAAPRPAGTQPGVQRPAHGSGPREPRTAAPASAQDPDADVGDDAARWPSPGPRSQAQETARPPAADRGTRITHTPAGGARHPSPAGAGAGSPADWRDEILSEARQPWQPGPSWPHHPAIHRTPETAATEPGIEPGR
jgi:tetratricopeptide (TPR) repeat protein